MSGGVRGRPWGRAVQVDAVNLVYEHLSHGSHVSDAIKYVHEQYWPRVGSSTLARWVTFYGRCGCVPADAGQQQQLARRRRRMAPEHLQALKAIIDRQCDLYMDEIQSASARLLHGSARTGPSRPCPPPSPARACPSGTAAQCWNVTSAHTTRCPHRLAFERNSTYLISKALRSINYSLKTLNHRARQRDEQERTAFDLTMSAVDAHQIVFLDESHADAQTARRRRGWALRGKRPTVFERLGCERYTLMAAINHKGFLLESNGARVDACRVIRHDVQVDGKTKGSTAQDFLDWFRMDLFPNLGNYAAGEENSSVVLDNCSFHHREWGCDTTAVGRKRHLYQFLPPYSPDKVMPPWPRPLHAPCPVCATVHASQLHSSMPPSVTCPCHHPHPVCAPSVPHLCPICATICATVYTLCMKLLMHHPCHHLLPVCALSRASTSFARPPWPRRCLTAVAVANQLQNPIEECFSYVKQRIRRTRNDYNTDAPSCILNACRQLGASTTASYYRDCGYRIAQGRQQDDPNAVAVVVLAALVAANVL